MSQKSAHQYDNVKSNMSNKHRTIQNPQSSSKNDQRSLAKDIQNTKTDSYKVDELSNKSLDHSSHISIVKQESATKSGSKMYGQTQSSNNKMNQQMDLNIDTSILINHDDALRSETPTNSPKSKQSIFSPITDWKDNTSSLLSTGSFIQNTQSNSMTKYGNKDSPKKNQSYYDKKTTPIKKEKSESSGSSQPKSNSAEKKNNTTKPKLDISVLNSGSVKRPFDVVVKHSNDNEIIRDSKHRKLDIEANLVETIETKSNFISLPLNNTYSNTGNGFETNPDLVSNLLKESLCTEKLESSFNSSNSGLDEISQLHMLATDTCKVKKERMDNIDYNSESIKIKVKKPKKEKHKHKDRSKDKDDKKKHKKDKERHKNRSPSESNDHTSTEGHIKIKINKDKLGLPSNHEHDSKSFKIKIPKDRIKTDLPSTDVSSHKNTGGNSLKIKISKDVLDSYSHNSADSANLMFNSDSVKRKDRDKSKSSRNEHNNKLNGNLNNTSNSSANQCITSNTTNSNKFDFINSI